MCGAVHASCSSASDVGAMAGDVSSQMHGALSCISLYTV